MLLGIEDVCRLTSLSRATIYREESAGRFPRRRQITRRAVGWLESELRQWIESRPVAGRAA